MPMAFSEHGVLMLSSVLKSRRARQVNIHIMRVYSKLRKLVLTHKELLIKLNELEAKMSTYDRSMQKVFEYLQQFIQEQNEPMEPIGFKQAK